MFFFVSKRTYRLRLRCIYKTKFTFTYYYENALLHRLQSLIKNKLLQNRVYIRSMTKTQSKLYKIQQKIYALSVSGQSPTRHGCRFIKTVTMFSFPASRKTAKITTAKEGCGESIRLRGHAENIGQPLLLGSKISVTFLCE